MKAAERHVGFSTGATGGLREADLLINERESDAVTVCVGPRGMPLDLYGQVAQLFLPVRPAGPGHSSGLRVS